MHFQPTGSGQGFHLGVRRAYEPDVHSGPGQSKAEMKSRGDRSGAASLMQDLEDGRSAHGAGSP